MTKLNREKAVRIISLMDQLKAELVGTFISVEGSTTAAEVEEVKEVIEFEGKNYQKVDREAKVGDVVIFRKNFSSLVYKNKVYKVNSSFKGEPTFVGNIGSEYCVYNNGFGRTPKTVDVYELIQEEEKSTNGTLYINGKPHARLDEVTTVDIKQPKFKVGDKIKVINRSGMNACWDLLDDYEYEVVDVLPNGNIVILNGDKYRLQIYKTEFKNIELVTEQPKTPNQQRKEVIEKAKIFLQSDEHKDNDGHYAVPDKKSPYPTYCEVEFVVNEKKRTVVALMKVWCNGIIFTRGITKCNPSDVFNAEIGKAIALGRALGLDVSEFENVVQPTEIVVGHTVQGIEPGFTYLITTITEMFPKMDGQYGKAFKHTKIGWLGEKQVKVINDTNAQY